jgi:hypothetical protein
MAVYVDEAIWVWKGRRWCHLMADDVCELHRFAHRLGLQLSSYQGPPKTAAPHYDITGFERSRAIRLGAVAIGRREVVELVRAQKSPRAMLAPKSRAAREPALSRA